MCGKTETADKDANMDNGQQNQNDKNITLIFAPLRLAPVAATNTMLSFWIPPVQALFNSLIRSLSSVINYLVVILFSAVNDQQFYIVPQIIVPL